MTGGDFGRVACRDCGCECFSTALLDGRCYDCRSQLRRERSVEGAFDGVENPAHQFT